MLVLIFILQKQLFLLHYRLFYQNQNIHERKQKWQKLLSAQSAVRKLR